MATPVKHSWDERDDSSGRYTASPPCDCCGKPVGTDYCTDEAVCGSGDGPGFYLCNRVRCGKKYEGLSVDARRALFTAGRAQWGAA